MLLLRPIRENDLAGLVGLARATGGGLTTLPPEESFLGDRIEESVRAFRPRVRRPGGEFYLFILEDTETREVIGVSGIASRVGGFDPWYSYELRVETHAHTPLGIRRDIPVLHLKTEHRGPSELCSLFLRPDRRRGGTGRLLSLGRFLFIAAQRERFTEHIIAEMRGYIDQTGRSPFWEAVGRHFFEFDFYRADVLSGLGEKQFIADLMPRHPIYAPLLPADVQAAIGRVHHETEPALALLVAEGFAPMSEVDIFDAGPLVRSPVEHIRTIRAAKLMRLSAVDDAVAPNATKRLLANGALDYRACIGSASINDDFLSVPAEVARALNIDVGAKVWTSPLR